MSLTLQKFLSHCDEAQTVICAQWEAWAQSIARAVDEEQPLPAPPVPDADTVGVTPTLLRILQASAFAAAALARNLKQAEVRWKSSCKFVCSNGLQSVSCGYCQSLGVWCGRRKSTIWIWR
eukprot:1869716-Amphidinium_carterae.1